MGLFNKLKQRRIQRQQKKELKKGGDGKQHNGAKLTNDKIALNQSTDDTTPVASDVSSSFDSSNNSGDHSSQQMKNDFSKSVAKDSIGFEIIQETQMDEYNVVTKNNDKLINNNTNHQETVNKSTDDNEKTNLEDDNIIIEAPVNLETLLSDLTQAQKKGKGRNTNKEGDEHDNDDNSSDSSSSVYSSSSDGDSYEEGEEVERSAKDFYRYLMACNDRQPSTLAMVDDASTIGPSSQDGNANTEDQKKKANGDSNSDDNTLNKDNSLNTKSKNVFSFLDKICAPTTTDVITNQT